MRIFLKGFTFLVSVIALSSISTLASAKCSFDLRGTWQSYTLYANGAYYAACTFSTDRDGNLEDSSFCDIYEEDGSDFNIGLTATGQYVTDDACNVTGSLSIGAGAGIVSILNARMSNGGSLINGVETVTSSAGLETIGFTMFRLN
jgi:hypothetical protein